jgi:hypothetical protein
MYSFHPLRCKTQYIDFLGCSMAFRAIGRMARSLQRRA